MDKEGQIALDINQIRTVFDENTIRVYQAFPDVIAREAVRIGTFGEHFKMDRMTWIKIVSLCI